MVEIRKEQGIKYDIKNFININIKKLLFFKTIFSTIPLRILKAPQKFFGKKN